MPETGERTSDSRVNLLKTVGAVLGGVLSLVAILSLVFDARIDSKVTKQVTSEVEAKVGEKFDDFTTGEGKEFRSVVEAALEKWSGLVPIGTVVAFAGDSIPHGWLLCDGRELKKEDYKPLFGKIGTKYGDGGDNDDYFSLPDYRGMFLRGVSGGAPIERDPDRDDRRPPYLGGKKGNTVGSIQDDATRLPNKPFCLDTVGHHTHAAGDFKHVLRVNGEKTAGSLDRTPPTEPNLASSEAMKPAGEHSHVIDGGDEETRPKNVYVNWIIKYSHRAAEKAGGSS